MNPLIQLKKVAALFVVAFACLALLPTTQAVSPAPDGCYPNFTTAEGCDALSLLTTGAANTGLGWRSLFSNTDGSFNTATGAGTLLFNTGDNNTAAHGAFEQYGGLTRPLDVRPFMQHHRRLDEHGHRSSAALVIQHHRQLTTRPDGLMTRSCSNTDGNNNTASRSWTRSSTTPPAGFKHGLWRFAVPASTSPLPVTLSVSAPSGANVSNSCYIGNIDGTFKTAQSAAVSSIPTAAGSQSLAPRFKKTLRTWEPPARCCCPCVR